MTRYIAGLDIGGTTGRLKLKSIDGDLLGEVYGQGCSINTDGDKISEERYRNLILPALLERGLKPHNCACICVAASGIDSPELEETCRKFFINMGFQENSILIYNDCELFLHISEPPCLVLVAGTGSICYGKNKNGKVVRTGGWGHILSDEGSAFHIGMLIIKHLGDHMDERDDCPVLYRQFCEKTGIRNLSELNEYVNANLMNKAVIADLAPLASQSFAVAENAGISIIKESTKALADLVKDTCKKMSIEQMQELDLWLWGSVLLKNEPVRKQLEDCIRNFYPGIKIGIPKKSALDVAITLAENSMIGI